ncbi:AAA family ATPase [Hymenobacter sp. BT664]|uniref:AAA family ATPase n=1 Tax=Hymenobacter montanus TaxID=2771359 RepID=A0A927GIC9_9BACT|nr:AAA family ATPase [Hymenobacter montanus]MBD2767318.1 AAA family ATPase [Hymenobacter montanus]
MENAIKFLRIQNFKSIKDVTLHPRRVNLIIGEPNVGKSNLLEAMSLLGGITYEQTEKFMGSFIRYEEPRQLFYDNLVANTIKVETDKDVAILVFEKEEKLFQYLFCNIEFYEEVAGSVVNKPKNSAVGKGEHYMMRNTLGGKFNKRTFDGVIPEYFINTQFGDNANFSINGERLLLLADYVLKEPPLAFSFQKNKVDEDHGSSSLTPPSGSNLIEIIQTHSKLRKEITALFARYNQKLQLRMDERRIEIIKDQDGITYSYPYSSVADTLQRIIFYLAAIESNDDAVLLFEEPEAHSFPVYVSKLGRRIVESRNNQFFIDTHSPYLITEILETMLTDDEQVGELAIFAAYYEDHQTKVHQLSDEEIRSIRNDSIDVFYNMKRFTTGTADA